MKVTLFTVFWLNGNIERTRNASFSQIKLKNLCDFLKKNDVDADFFTFDFSIKKTIDSSVHMPYNPSQYHRSKKMNMSMNHILKKNNSDVFCQFDSDIFLNEDKYVDFLNLLKNLKDNEFFIAQVLDISEKSLGNINFDSVDVDLNDIIVTPRTITGLGAVFITHTKNIIEVGGFDERFEVWGGEDDDLAERLMRLGKLRKLCPFNYYHLPHKSLEAESKNNIKYHEQVNIIRSDSSNIRPSFMNNYNIK
jgi:predicted glycosyltransferase involved in capsule biosynthesis